MRTLDRGAWSRCDGSWSPAQALYTALGQRPQPGGAATTCPPARGQVRPAAAQVRQLCGRPPLSASGRSLHPGGPGLRGRAAGAPWRPHGSTNQAGGAQRGGARRLWKLKVRKEPRCRRGCAESRMVGRAVWGSPQPPNAVRPPWGIFPSLPGRAQGLHVGGHPWQVIRPGGAAMGAGRGPPEVPSPRGLALSGHLRSSCLRRCSWLPHDQQGPRAQPHRLAWPPTWLLDLTVFAVAVGLPALSPRPRGPSPQGPSPQGHRAMLVLGHLPFL